MKASDSLDEILKACGVSAIERMILDNAPITQDVRQTRDEITIDIASGPYHRTDVMWLDGRRTKSEDPAGRPVVSESFWNDEGTAVITKIWQENLLDFPPWTMTRTLSEDGNTAYVLNEYAPVEGAAVGQPADLSPPRTGAGQIALIGCQRIAGGRKTAVSRGHAGAPAKSAHLTCGPRIADGQLAAGLLTLTRRASEGMWGGITRIPSLARRVSAASKSAPNELGRGSGLKPGRW